MAAASSSKIEVDLVLDEDDLEFAAANPAPAKRRRTLDGLDPWVEETDAQKRSSDRLKKVEADREINSFKRQLAEAEGVTSRLFKKLEAMERRADRAEEAL